MRGAEKWEGRRERGEISVCVRERRGGEGGRDDMGRRRDVRWAEGGREWCRQPERRRRSHTRNPAAPREEKEEEEEEERRDFPFVGFSELCSARTKERSDCRDGCLDVDGRDGCDLSIRLKSSSWDGQTDGQLTVRTGPPPHVRKTSLREWCKAPWLPWSASDYFGSVSVNQVSIFLTQRLGVAARLELTVEGKVPGTRFTC